VFENLKVKPLQRASSTWANALVDAVEQVYWLGKRGDPDTPFEELYGYYGYFFDNVFVQGKPVIKDGDPISIYDIQEPAKESITQAIDQSKVAIIEDYSKNLTSLPTIESYTSQIKDKVVKVRMDEYGNVGIFIAEPLDEYGRLPVSVEDAFKPVSSYGSVSASQNTSGYSLVIEKGGRPNVSIWFKLGGAGTVVFQVSRNGTDWRDVESFTLSNAGEQFKTYGNIAYPYVRLTTSTTGVSVEFEIVASR